MFGKPSEVVPPIISSTLIDQARLANTIEVRFHEEPPPVEVMAAVARADSRLKYSSARHLFHCIWIGGPCGGPYDYCGVFGDGDNGAYEWFIWEAGKLETSDKGYGDTTIALRDVLNLLTQRGTL